MIYDKTTLTVNFDLDLGATCLLRDPSFIFLKLPPWAFMSHKRRAAFYCFDEKLCTPLSPLLKDLLVPKDLEGVGKSRIAAITPNTPGRTHYFRKNCNVSSEERQVQL